MKPHTISLLFVLIVGSISSCRNESLNGEPFNTLVATCDQVNITYYNGGDTLHYETKDSLGIKILTHLLFSKKEAADSSCPATGQLHYLSHNTPVLDVRFAISDSVTNKACNDISYQSGAAIYRYQMTIRAARLLKEIRAANAQTHASP